VVTIKVHFVNGSYNEFTLSDKEMLYKIIGDDFAAPPSGFSIEQDQEGKVSNIHISGS